MSITPATTDDVRRVFEEAVGSLPNCTVTQDLDEYNRLFRDALTPRWEQAGQTVQHMKIEPRCTIFRVSCKVDLEEHGDGLGSATLEKMRQITEDITSLDLQKIISATVTIDPLSVENAPFGKIITLTARGIIQTAIDQPQADAGEL